MKFLKKEDEAIIQEINQIVFSKKEILNYIETAIPLTSESIDKYSEPPGLYEPAYNHMNSYEKEVALLFMSKGLLVYREIPIGSNGSTADFYVYNPKSKRGKLVEVTLIQQSYKPGEKKPSIKTRKRKSRQLVLLKATGMPFVILYKENLNSIRKRLNTDLF